MALTVQEIERQAQHIRDYLSPLVSDSGGTGLTSDSWSSILQVFEKLEMTSMSSDMLRQSRIDRALLEICMMGTEWPASLVERAEHILQQWEEHIGRVGELRDSLWEPGRPMAGCHKRTEMEAVVLKSKGKPTKTVMVRRKQWVVDAKKLAKASYYGDAGFEVGSWWIKAACAYRDGMLEDPNSDIAVSDYGACAIVLARGSETENADGTSTWTCTKADVKVGLRGLGVLSLMTNMRNHTDVRVLRHWKLRSILAPRGGVRYDGLYSITGHGLKRIDEISYYSFRLRRSKVQKEIEKALVHPTADEYDDWMEYRKIQEGKKATEKVMGNRLTSFQAINEMDGTQEEHAMDSESDWTTVNDESEQSVDDEEKDYTWYPDRSEEGGEEVAAHYPGSKDGGEGRDIAQKNAENAAAPDKHVRQPESGSPDGSEEKSVLGRDSGYFEK